MRTHTRTHTVVPYLSVDLIEQGKQKRVEVSQEEGEDSSQLPLEGDTRVVVLQLSDGLKQGRTHQTQQRHDDLKLDQNRLKSPLTSSNQNTL